MSSDVIKTILGVLGAAVILYFAVITKPEPTDYCSTHMIERHTEVIIAYKDCQALGEQCVITPVDTRRFNSAQTDLDACIAKAVE